MRAQDIFHIILLIVVVLIYFYNKMFLHSKYKNIYFVYLLIASLSLLIHLIESFINKNFFAFQYGANMLHEITRALFFTSGIFLLDMIINAIGNHLCRELTVRKGFLYDVCVFIQVFIVLFLLYSLYGFIATNIFHRFTFDFFMNSENPVY